MSSQISNLTITRPPFDRFGKIRAFFDRSVALDRLVALLVLLEYRLYENFSSRGTRTIIIHPVCTQNYAKFAQLPTNHHCIHYCIVKVQKTVKIIFNIQLYSHTR